MFMLPDLVLQEDVVELTRSYSPYRCFLMLLMPTLVTYNGPRSAVKAAIVFLSRLMVFFPAFFFLSFLTGAIHNQFLFYVFSVLHFFGKPLKLIAGMMKALAAPIGSPFPLAFDTSLGQNSALESWSLPGREESRFSDSPAG